MSPTTIRGACALLWVPTLALAAAGRPIATASPSSPAPLAAAPVLVEDWETAKAELAEQTAAALDELASNCQTERVYLQRDLAYEALLLLDPDHAQARKTLGWIYSRKDGAWKRKRSYRSPQDRDPGRAEAARAERELVLARYRDRVLELLDETDGLSLARRRAELEQLLLLCPDDPVVRGLNGQARLIDADGNARWVTQEIPLALEKRSELEERVRALVAEVALDEFAIDSWESGLGVRWNALRGSSRVKVYGSAEADAVGEVERAARHVHAVFDFLPPLVGGETPAPDDFRVYLVASDPGRDAFLSAYPEMRAPDREVFKDLASGWLVWGRLGCWGGGAPQRIDSAVRQTVSFYLWRTHEISDKQGWIEQGLGLYLTYRVVGTRLSFAVDDGEYTSTGRPDWAAAIHDDNADFLALAAEMLEDAKRPKIPFSLGKSVSSMTSGDLLLAYALSAYLVEGHEPSVLEAILQRCGAGESPVLVLEQVLGYDIPRLERRLLEWLRETGSASRASPG
jgi:hypothetical protein